MKHAGLGKGLEGLLPTNFDTASVAGGETIRQLPLGALVPNPDQPRREFDEQALQELASSLKIHGVIQPLVVTPQADNQFRIVAGERRFRAAQIAGLKTVPVIIRNHKELEEIEIALVENIQRVDLSPLEQALSIMKLRDQFSLSPKQIAQKLGRAEATISNTMRLLQLPKSAIEALQKQRISEGHARAILAVKFDTRLQDELLHTIVTNSISVRETEEWVKQRKIEAEQKNSSISKKGSSLLKSLQSNGMQVSVQERKKGGILTVRYDDINSLELILEKLQR